MEHIYVRLIKKGLITLEDVPEEFKEKVRELLNE